MTEFNGVVRVRARRSSRRGDIRTANAVTHPVPSGQQSYCPPLQAGFKRFRKAGRRAFRLLRRPFVLFAVWWFEEVSMAVSSAVYDRLFALGPRYYRLATIVELCLLRYVLLGKFAWWIAGAHILRKWDKADHIYWITRHAERGQS